MILPLLILLVFGIVQFSLAYNRQQGLHAAARKGARIASLPQTTQTEINTPHELVTDRHPVRVDPDDHDHAERHQAL